MNILPVRLFLLVLMCALTWSSTAQHFTLFPKQRVMYSTESDDDAYRLMLGSLKKINGFWESEREEIIEGRVFRQTFELGPPWTLDTAWSHVDSYFNQREGAELIYQCEGFSCGSSNAWANVVFEVKQLYGLDSAQKYQVWQLKEADSLSLAVLYLVQRGNQRLYFHIDHLVPSSEALSFAPSAEVISRKFYAEGTVVVSGLAFGNGQISIDPRYIKALARALNEQPFRRLDVVGHDFTGATEAERMTRSQDFAQAVASALVQSGVQLRRIQVRAIGSAAPEAGNTGARVVVSIRR